MKDVVEIMREFFCEALRFLKLPVDQWPEIVEEFRFDPEHKITPPYVDYGNRKFVIHVPFTALCSIKRPTEHRSWAYMNAWKWYRFATDGIESNLADGEAILFSLSLMTIKGIQVGSNPGVNLRAIAAFMTEKLGMPATVVPALDKSGHGLMAIRFTSNESNLRTTKLQNLAVKSGLMKPPKFNNGKRGSQDNPFENVDEAADYLIRIEKEALKRDVYRTEIANEQFFFDYEHGIFRIPWASANVGYYDFGSVGDNGFVVNQMQSGRFSLKPILHNHKYLFRGQCEYFKKCTPSLFRPRVKDRMLSEHMQTYELAMLLRTHPLVKLLGSGIELFHDRFVFEMNYLGLSQHYYNCTEYLDLTSRIDIAKFFAVTTFDFDNDRYVKYDGDKLGVLYLYSIEPRSFSHENYGTRLTTIGKQVFMRSGNQAGFLLKMKADQNFNAFPNVRAVFFRHDKAITDRIFTEFKGGDTVMPEEMLRDVWYNRLATPGLKCRISDGAVDMYLKDYPERTKPEIVARLQHEGIQIVNEPPSFTSNELSAYYRDAPANWQEFVKDIHFYSPEGLVLKRHLERLPDDPRYRHAFFRP